MEEFNIKYNEAKEWMESFIEANSIFPTAFDIYQDFTKHKSLLDIIPETENNLKVNIESKLLEPISLFVRSLGPKLNVDPDGIKFSGATAASGSAFVLDEVINYNANDTEWKVNYKNETFKMIKEIQAQRDSIEFIIEKLTFIHQPLGKEFSDLTDLYQRYISTIEFSSSFGIKLRNVLEHFRGICNKAAIIIQGKDLKDTDGLSWVKISENIALKGKGSRYDNEFKKNSSIYTKLHDSLSKDAKDYNIEDIQKLKDTFITCIQYFQSSLQMINLGEIKKNVI